MINKSKSKIDCGLKSDLAKSYSILGKIISFLIGSIFMSLTKSVLTSIPNVVSVTLLFR